MGEVVWQSRDDAHAWPGLLRKRVSNYAAREPLKASMLAMAIGAMLTIALQRGLAQGQARS